jgi:hypothetical protein
VGETAMKETIIITLKYPEEFPIDGDKLVDVLYEFYCSNLKKQKVPAGIDKTITLERKIVRKKKCLKSKNS